MWTVIALLLVLWLVGMLLSISPGGVLHILLVAAAVLLILQLVRGRGPKQKDEG